MGNSFGGSLFIIELLTLTIISTNRFCENFRALVYEFGHVSNNADAKCIKLTNISASCKFIVSNDIPTNTASGVSRGAFPTSYVYQEIGEFEEKSVKAVERVRKLNAHLRERVANQVRDASAGWIRRRKIPNIIEFTRMTSGNGGYEEMSTAENPGGLKSDNAFETISLGRSQIINGKCHFL